MVLISDIVGLIIEYLEIIDPEAVVLLDKNSRDKYFTKNGIWIKPVNYSQKMRKLEIPKDLNKYPIKLVLSGTVAYPGREILEDISKILTSNDWELLEYIRQNTVYIKSGYIGILDHFPKAKVLTVGYLLKKWVISESKNNRISCLKVHLYKNDLYSKMEKIERLRNINCCFVIRQIYAADIIPQWIADKIIESDQESLESQNENLRFPALTTIFSVKFAKFYPIERFPKLSKLLIAKFDSLTESELTRFAITKRKNKISEITFGLHSSQYSALVQGNIKCNNMIRHNSDILRMIAFYNKYGSGNIRLRCFCGPELTYSKLFSLFGLFPLTLVGTDADGGTENVLLSLLFGPVHDNLIIKILIDSKITAGRLTELSKRLLDEKKLYIKYNHSRISRFYEYSNFRYTY